MTEQAVEQQHSPVQDREPDAMPAPARFTLLYESRDGKLCLFQDAQGHLTAVRSAQLA